MTVPSRLMPKARWVLGNNTCVSIDEVLGIGCCFPGKYCCLICFLTENGCKFVKKHCGLWPFSCHYKIWDCRCNVTARRTIANVVHRCRAGHLVSATVIPPVTFVVVSAIVLPLVAVVVVSAVVVPPAAVIVVSAICVLPITIIVPTVKVMRQCAHQQNE